MPSAEEPLSESLITTKRKDLNSSCNKEQCSHSPCSFA